MKSKRHEKILELIRDHDIETQEQLLARLNENGFDVTQATISRDIKELRLYKRVDRTGKTRYQTEYCKGECSGTGRFWCAARTRGCGTGILAGAG